MFGEIWTKDGRNVTAEKRARIAAAKLKDVPLDKAVKIGNGRNKVIEFTDPDCPYCRKAAEFFKGRNDVTLYVFFFPLPIHKDAQAHARYVLCAADKARPGGGDERSTGRQRGTRLLGRKGGRAPAGAHGLRHEARGQGNPGLLDQRPVRGRGEHPRHRRPSWPEDGKSHTT